jgi:ankyrin repeat protein
MKPLDRDGRSELHYAAGNGNLAAVQALLAEGANVNLRDKDGWGPLHFAAQATSEEVVRFLLSVGAIVDLEDSYGNTPLARATFSSRGEGGVILALREAGADPLRQNRHGVSPLALARMIANYDVAQFYNDIKSA